MSKVKNAPKSATKNEVVNAPKSASIKKVGDTLYVSAEAKPNEVKRALGLVQGAKIEANKINKSRRTRFNEVLADYKIDGKVHLEALNKQHGKSWKMSDVAKLEAKDLTPYMTEGDKKRQDNNGNQWKFWM
jgi:hypothetical protein